ncbi:MAG: hypothetical protein ACKVTZ_03295, partial [Bacteroidia bacterium]
QLSNYLTNTNALSKHFINAYNLLVKTTEGKRLMDKYLIDSKEDVYVSLEGSTNDFQMRAYTLPNATETFQFVFGNKQRPEAYAKIDFKSTSIKFYATKYSETESFISNIFVLAFNNTELSSLDMKRVYSFVIFRKNFVENPSSSEDGDIKTTNLSQDKIATIHFAETIYHEFACHVDRKEATESHSWYYGNGDIEPEYLRGKKERNTDSPYDIILTQLEQASL